MIKILVLNITWNDVLPTEYHPCSTRDECLNTLVQEMIDVGIIKEIDLDINTLTQLTIKHKVSWSIHESVREESYPGD